uniref:Secreted protein n=1 Tax=Brugia timori TaxID=42155 RepID=A0A0R3QW44_9BILA
LREFKSISSSELADIIQTATATTALFRTIYFYSPLLLRTQTSNTLQLQIDGIAFSNTRNSILPCSFLPTVFTFVTCTVKASMFATSYGRAVCIGDNSSKGGRFSSGYHHQHDKQIAVSAAPSAHKRNVF